MRCDCGILIAGDDEAPTSSCNGLQRGGERSWSLREVEGADGHGEASYPRCFHAQL